jgi:hypothetical protein
VSSYSFPVPSKHSTSVRGFRFISAPKGTGAGVEEDGSALIAEGLWRQGQREAVEIYIGREGLPVWNGTSNMPPEKAY